MADISKIKIGNSVYDLKDTEGRNLITWKQPALLWEKSGSNTWTNGGQKTLSTAPNYLFFGCITENTSGTIDSKRCYFGTWSNPVSRTSNQSVCLWTSFDTGNRSYAMLLWFQISGSGQTWKLDHASGHELTSSGNYHVQNNINKLWGLM